MKKILSAITNIICILLCHSALFGQLYLPPYTELYRDDVVARIDIFIDQESLDYILAPENRDSDELFPATFIFSNDAVQDTLEQVGFRLRGNTSRSAKKKSFKIDVNEFVPGRKFYGVKSINLNGQHNDPTVCRAKICADLADALRVPSMRTNHVELYINNEYRGLYTNVEHIDQRFVKERFKNQNGNLYKCLYPADLDYKGNNPDVYKEIIYGRRNYDLRTNTETDDYTDFAEFVKILNLTSISNLNCELEEVFNVDQYLRTIVLDILTGNWDGPIYNQNNFYLYHNEDTDLFEYIPYDLDNTLGIDWLNRDWGNRDIYSWSQTNHYRPIYTRIMGVPEYRNRFSWYMQEALINIFNEAELYPYLDDLKNQLAPYIVDDEYYSMDYGFDLENFNDGFEFALPFTQTDYGLKGFVQTRLISAFNQLDIQPISPIITDVSHNVPAEDEKFSIGAKIVDDQGIDNVQLCYTINDQPETCLDMQLFEDDVYVVSIDPLGEVGDFTFTIKAEDDSSMVSLYPSCNPKQLLIESSQVTIAINEFMAKNNSFITDIRGEYDDWIELYNFGQSPIYLGDKYLTDNIENANKWQLPNITLESGEYYLIWADDDRQQGRNHTNFKIGASGGQLALYESFEDEYRLIDHVEFENQLADLTYGRLPNGTGSFFKLVPTPGGPNQEISTAISEEYISTTLYPNPTDNQLTIRSSETIESIAIINASGEKLIETSTNLIDVSGLKSGLYFIQIISNEGNSKIERFLKI